MAKMRGIKPETFTDDKVLRLSPLARWLFVGMWTLACDNGHLEDNAVQLKVRLLPMDTCDVDALVGELLATGQVTRHDGYLKVAKLAEHQRIDKRFLLLCEWCEHDEHTTFTPSDKAPRTTGTQRVHDVQPTSTPSAHVDEGEGEGEKKVKSSAPAAPSRATDDRFPEFWGHYPKKKDRGHALKAWKTATKTVDPQTIIDGLLAQLPVLKASDPKFIPYGSTWLNGQRWADEITKADQPKASGWWN